MEYKSSELKLRKFFQSSRDGWKDKTKKLRVKVKNLENKLRYHKDTSTKLRDENKLLVTKVELLEANLGLKKTG